MHELGMCQSVVSAIEHRANGREVAAVGVRAGTLLRVVDEAFTTSFRMAAAGTVAADAQVDLEVVPLAATCRSCGEAFTTDDPWPACPACDAVEVDREGGHELTLVWLRYRAEAAEQEDGADGSIPVPVATDVHDHGH